LRSAYRPSGSGFFNLTLARRHRPGSRPGFSLLEIIVTIILLTIVLMAMATVFPSGYRLNQKNRNTTRAAEIANGIMEEINNLPFYGAGNTLQTLTSWTPRVWQPSTTIPEPFFLTEDPPAIQVGFVATPAGGNVIAPTLARIIVTVSWNETRGGQSRVRTVTLMTFRSSNDLRH